MKNSKVARLFYEMADVLEIQGVEWKPRAYRTAARNIEALGKDIEAVRKKGKLKDIPGVGEAIEKKIIEYLDTGKIASHDRLIARAPKKLFGLTQVPFLGPKKAKKLYTELNISSIAQLEKAAKEHRIAKLPGFGPKSEKDILEGLSMVKVRDRKLLKDILPIANKLVSRLKKLKAVGRVSLAGSIRRKKETIRDIDIIVSSRNPKRVISVFTSFPDVKKVIAHGPRKASVFLKGDVQADIRVFPPEEWGSGLLYFTGSKNFNINLRRIAMSKGYKLNEYGLFKGKTRIAGRTEAEVFKKLGLKPVPPEKRES